MRGPVIWLAARWLRPCGIDTLKVLPRPETQACVMLDGLDDAQAVAAMARALGSPYEVTGAAHLPSGPEGRPVTMLRIEGFETSVAYRADKLRALFDGHAVRIEDDAGTVADHWARIRDVQTLAGRDGDVWRISCKPSDGPALAARLGAEAHHFDWGGGLIWALLPAGTDARARLGDFRGHATRVRGTGDAPALQPEPGPLAALSDGLRARFDPRGILNPGLMTA